MFGISTFAEAPFASLAGQTVVVTLTGVQASGAVGTVVYTPVVAAAITGVQASGAVDTIAVGIRSVALSGVQASGAVGTIYTVIGTATGVQATGSVGTIAPTSRTVALTGVGATGQVGTMNYFYWSVIDNSQTPNWQDVTTFV